MVGLATYSSDQAAQDRLSSSVQAETAGGAKATDMMVGPDKGVLLVSGKWTLVVSHGPASVVVTAAPSLAPADKMQAVLTALADKALTPR